MSESAQFLGIGLTAYQMTASQEFSFTLTLDGGEDATWAVVSGEPIQIEVQPWVGTLSVTSFQLDTKRVVVEGTCPDTGGLKMLLPVVGTAPVLSGSCEMSQNMTVLVTLRGVETTLGAGRFTLPMD